MAKISGLGSAMTIQNSSAVAKDVANDVVSYTIDLPVALQDTTGIDKSAHERLALLLDTKIALKGVMNNATDRLHPVLSVGQTTARQIIITPPGGAGVVMTATCLISDYKVTRGSNGQMDIDATLELSNGSVGAWT